MSQIITNAFSRYWQECLTNQAPVVLDEFVLANVPNLDQNAPINPDSGLPPAGQIVHRHKVDQRGRINNDAVAYTIVMDTTVGDFSFNAMYLINKASGVVGMIVHKGLETKLKTDEATGQTGNSLVKSMLMEYDRAAEATATHVDANTWQIDYAARLRGMDDDLRLQALQFFGPATFYGDGFKLVNESGVYKVQPGVAYVGGLRAELNEVKKITPGAKPVGLWLDIYRAGSLLDAWVNHFTLTLSVPDMVDYLDSNGYQHHVAKVAIINVDGSVTDVRRKRTIELTGDVTGKGILEDAQGVSIVVEVKDGSHRHRWSELDNVPATASRWPSAEEAGAVGAVKTVGEWQVRDRVLAAGEMRVAADSGLKFRQSEIYDGYSWGMGISPYGSLNIHRYKNASLEKAVFQIYPDDTVAVRAKLYIEELDKPGMCIAGNNSGRYSEIAPGASGGYKWGNSLRYLHDIDAWAIGDNRIYHTGFVPNAKEVGAVPNRRIVNNGGNLNDLWSPENHGLYQVEGSGIANWPWDNVSPGSLMVDGIDGYPRQTAWRASFFDTVTRLRNPETGVWSQWASVYNSQYCPKIKNWHDFMETYQNVSGGLIWTGFGSGHAVVDASSAVSPDGGPISNSDAAVPWYQGLPTLVGWNGNMTYGVRVDSARVADSVKSNPIPAGVAYDWLGDIAPPGYAILGGQPFNVSTCPQLARLFPTGVLPDLRGHFIRVADAGRGKDPGRAVLTLQAEQIGPHMHTIGFTGNMNYSGGGGNANTNWGPGSNQRTNNNDGHENRPENIALNKIVELK